MIQRSKILSGLIGFLLVNLEVFMTSSTLNMLEFPEVDFLASELTPSECFQLYNMFRSRHLKVDAENFLRRKSYTIPCITLLSTWLTDPDEFNYITFDNITLKLTQIGREDLALELNRRNKTNSSGDKDMENKRDERSETFICPSKLSEKRKIFWEIFFIVLTILTVIFLCFCCCFCIYEKLRCTCNRTQRNYYGKNEENDEEYCLCADKLKETSFEDYCTNKKKPSYLKKKFSYFKEYFSNRKEQKKEKLRYEKFQKLKKKLQTMYLEQQKDIRVNRQEERILNSLTEKERDELGETICEMRFFLDSDKETERLLLSGKRSGTFIIDMKNLHRPKITHSQLTNQEIRKWKSRDRFSTSLSDEMTNFVSQRKTCSECEIVKRDREKKSHRKSNNRIREYEKYLKHERRKKNSKVIELEETSEFIKCYTMSESEQCSSPITKPDERFYESNKKSNFFTSEENEMSTFRSEKYDNTPTNKIQSDADNRKSNSVNEIKSKSIIELESFQINDVSQLSIEKENAETNNKNQNKEDYFNHQFYKLTENNDNLSKSINSYWAISTCNSKRNLEKSNENLPIFENLDGGDTESQLDFRKTCDELSLLVSQQMKQHSYPCQRKYCFLRRHLKQRAHDLKQCQFRQNYFKYYPNDDAPSCGAGQICRDTYDEFKLMRASPRKRKEIRQSIYKRRKEFLDQPCVSPKKKCFNYSSIGTM